MNIIEKEHDDDGHDDYNDDVEADGNDRLRDRWWYIE